MQSGHPPATLYGIVIIPAVFILVTGALMWRSARRGRVGQYRGRAISKAADPAGYRFQFQLNAALFIGILVVGICLTVLVMMRR
jgi:uncharacterized iron-regulated membrane protein